MKKKTVVIQSNFSKAFTGFGKHKKNILRYLFKTGKYNIVEFANGRPKIDPESCRTPWKTYGTLPEQQKLAQMDAQQQRAASYGSYCIDELIKEVKPDVYIGIEDIWAFDGFMDKPWWNKINSMLWTTLDSLPLLQNAIDAAPKVKNYYVWASFAEKAFNKLGYDHIKTLRGSLDYSNFYKFPKEKKQLLRVQHNLSNEFIIGFVFRNQLRKSVPNLLEGFKEFQKLVPNSKLLLHTHWSEGWDIKSLMSELDISTDSILTTYFCPKCQSYEILPFRGENINCKNCGAQNSMSTTNINQGVSEKQLNEIYNIMDVYCHPFTSGGQEIPIQEAKLTELITLVTEYSCGEDYCYQDSGGVPLKWSSYREPGTQFIKASTDPKDITDKLLDVYNWSSDFKIQMGQKARQFVIDNCSVDSIGRQLEEIIDSMPEVNWDFDFSLREFNPNYTSNFSILNNEEFIIDIHSGFLNEKIDKNHSSFKFWTEKIASGMSRDQVFDHFKKVAETQNSKQPIEFGDLLDKNPEDRIAVVIPQSETDVLLINSLIKNLKKTYSKHDIYIITRPQFFPLIEDNIYVHKCIPYSQNLDNLSILEGAGDYKGYFDIAFFPTTSTQKIITYIHNGKDKIQFQLT